MCIFGAVSSLGIFTVPSFFYTRFGRLLYLAHYITLSLSSFLRLYLLHGYVKLYYSHIITLEVVLLYQCAIQCA